MRVGVPKEIKTGEFRVGLTPAAVREYVACGHQVYVQTKAGVGIAAPDSSYELAGARIVPTADEVFEEAELIVKVKEPQRSEWERLREDQILFTYLHLAPDPQQAHGLIESGCAAVAYETVTDPQGRLPLLAPMSEVAGRLSIEAAAFGLRMHAGGRGLLMGGVPGVSPARVVVLGGGVVGVNAARMALGLGAEVSVVDKSVARLRELDAAFSGRLRTRYADRASIEEELYDADVVVGAALVPGASAPKLITRAMLQDLKPGSILVDVSIDQGGCFETSRATTHDAPTFVVDGIVHYCVANMPGSVPLTSTVALNNATLPYGLAIAAQGLDALRTNPGLREGLNICAGRITNRPVAEALGLPCTLPEVAIEKASRGGLAPVRRSP